MDPEARQRRLLGLMKRLTHAESAREPGVSVFEDLHWLDPASEAFLANQVEAVQGTRSLVVLNFRPEYHAPWTSRSYYRQIALAPLGPEATDEMLRYLIGCDASLDGLSGLIRERTRGNPFFNRGARAIAPGEPRTSRRARRLQARSAGGGNSGALECSGRPVGAHRPTPSAREESCCRPRP